ncbi:MAG: hypothetical protein AAF716_15545 [Cyanobacteria bacterium P01_D01_bin.1]
MSLIVLLLAIIVALWFSNLMDAFPALLWNWIHWPRWVAWIALISLLAWGIGDRESNR